MTWLEQSRHRQHTTGTWGRPTRARSDVDAVGSLANRHAHGQPPRSTAVHICNLTSAHICNCTSAAICDCAAACSFGCTAANSRDLAAARCCDLTSAHTCNCTAAHTCDLNAATFNDCGSAAIWALISVAVFGLVALVALTGVELTLHRLRMQTAADLTALTAAGRDCSTAEVIAAANDVSVRTCAPNPVDGSLTVWVQRIVQKQPLPRFTVSAVARAGIR